MKVENHPKGKETNIGATHFTTLMIMGGRVLTPKTPQPKFSLFGRAKKMLPSEVYYGRVYRQFEPQNLVSDLGCLMKPTPHANRVPPRNGRPH